MRKLFWALFVVGCGFNVHGVESSTKGTILGKRSHFSREKESGKKSIDDVNAELVEASEGGNIGGLQKLLQEDQEVKPDREGVRCAFIRALECNTLERNNMPIINALLQVKGHLALDKQDLARAFVHAVDEEKEDLKKRLLEEPDGRLVHRYDIFNFFKERGDSDPSGKARMYSDQIKRPLVYNFKMDFKMDFKIDFATLLLANSERPQLVEWMLEDGPMKTAKAMAEQIDEVNRIISNDRIRPEQHVVERALENLVPWVKVSVLAKIPFPKEVYEKSQTLSARLDQHPLSDEDFKRIMAIRTTDDRNSPFVEYILERFVAGKKGISPEMVKTLMINQYYQDAMALMKLRKQGATKVSKLPKGVFRCVLDYDQPNTRGV